MNRIQVYKTIDEERDYQDNLPESRTDGQRKQVGSFLALMEHVLACARADYYENRGDEAALHQVRKLAALAVACMEAHGAPRRPQQLSVTGTLELK